MRSRIEAFSRFIRMRILTFLIKLFFLSSCFLSIVQALQDNPFLTKDFANLFTAAAPSTSTTTQSPTTTSFPPPFNLPFQFTAPTSASSSPSSTSSSSSNSQGGSGINWNYPNIFKYQSINDKRQETSISTNNYNSNSQKRPVVNYGKAPIELYTMMSMKKGRYFPPPEDNDGYSGLVPKSGSNVIGPNGQLMQPGMDPSMGSGFAAMQGMDSPSSAGYDMGGYSTQNSAYSNPLRSYLSPSAGFGSGQGMGYGGQSMSYAGQGMSYAGQGMGYASQGMGYGAGLGMMPQATSPYASAASYGMSSPYGYPSTGMSPMTMYANQPSYLGYPNMQPAASSLYSSYAGYGGGGYGAAPSYPGFGYGIGGYGSGMYPMMSGGLLGAASQTMGSILSPFAALAQPRYPYLFPFG